jgi:hypothetical protein
MPVSDTAAAMTDPSDAYTNQVAAIVAARSRPSSYRPDVIDELFIVDRREVPSSEAVSAIERRQLDAMFRGEDMDAILANGYEGDGPINLEVARVVDASGALRYRLWGMDFGAIFLMAPDSLHVVAFTGQHNLEHWSPDQRALFYAMDRALQRPDHGFRQPMEWCWWDDAHWAEIATKPPGSMYSEAGIRRQFADG